MHASLLDILACPACRIPYQAHAVDGNEQILRTGYLACPGCAILIPVLEGFVFFTHPLLHAGMATPAALAELASRLLGESGEFPSYCRNKRERSVMEPYAAFQPWNESSRAIEPLLPYIAPSLQPGGFILDTWCRTGWSGEWLAGRFPGQRIVSLWEGDSSVLGFRGFRNLMAEGQRAANLDILFTPPGSPLPFHNEAFQFIYALDCLHRYSLNPFAGECLRVGHREAPVVFAHLHLNNGQPDPYFERGCNQWHGRDYRQWLDRISDGTPRRGWVFNELGLFRGPVPAPLVDDPDMAHYNGLVALLPADAVPASDSMPLPDRLLVSPLFRLDAAGSTCRVARTLAGGQVGWLLDRHPAYRDSLPAGSVALGDQGLALVLMSVTGMPVADILSCLADGAPGRLDGLRRLELLLPVTLSSNGHRLQAFHANQYDEYDLPALPCWWQALERLDTDCVFLPDGQPVTGSELHELAWRLAMALSVRLGDKHQTVSMAVTAHPLLLVTALALVSQGFHVHLASASMPLHPEATFAILGDDMPAPSEVASMPLGLKASSGLVSLLEDSCAAPALAVAERPGMLMGGAAGDAYCLRLDMLATGCRRLRSQLDNPPWVSGEASPLGTVIAFMTAVAHGTPLQFMG